MQEELLGVMVRARGDAKTKIEGLDLDAQGRRVRRLVDRSLNSK